MYHLNRTERAAAVVAGTYENLHKTRNWCDPKKVGQQGQIRDAFLSCLDPPSSVLIPFPTSRSGICAAFPSPTGPKVTHIYFHTELYKLAKCTHSTRTKPVTGVTTAGHLTLQHPVLVVHTRNFQSLWNKTGWNTYVRISQLPCSPANAARVGFTRKWWRGKKIFPRTMGV